MASCRASVDAEFMLHAQHLGVAEIQEIRRPTIGVQIFLVQFKPDPGRIVVSIGPVVDGTGETVGFGRRRGDRFAEIVGEGGDAAETGQVAAQEGDAFRGRRVHIPTPWWPPGWTFRAWKDRSPMATVVSTFLILRVACSFA